MAINIIKLSIWRNHSISRRKSGMIFFCICNFVLEPNVKMHFQILLDSSKNWQNYRLSVVNFADHELQFYHGQLS